MHPDDIPIEMPEGKWRLGQGHKKVGISRKSNKWPDKCTSSYAMLDFESDKEKYGKYLVIERLILQI